MLSKRQNELVLRVTSEIPPEISNETVLDDVKRASATHKATLACRPVQGNICILTTANYVAQDVLAFSGSITTTITTLGMANSPLAISVRHNKAIIHGVPTSPSALSAVVHAYTEPGIPLFKDSCWLPQPMPVPPNPPLRLSTSSQPMSNFQTLASVTSSSLTGNAVSRITSQLR